MISYLTGGLNISNKIISLHQSMKLRKGERENIRILKPKVSASSANFLYITLGYTGLDRLTWKKLIIIADSRGIKFVDH